MRKQIILGLSLLLLFILSSLSLNAQNWLWAKSATGPAAFEAASGHGVATDPAGNVYVAGYFNGTPSFGAFSLSSVSGFGFFLVKYNSTGTVLWATNPVATTNTYGGYGVAADAFGNVYVTGGFGSATATFGSFTLTNSGGNHDIFLAKYDGATGNVVWAKSVSGTADESANDVAVDNTTGNVYITGRFESPTLNFGSVTANTSPGYRAMYLAKYDASGNALWAVVPGTVGFAWDEGFGVAIDKNTGNVCITGAVWSNVFVALYNSAGTSLWTKTSGGGGSGYDGGEGVDFDVSGNVCVTGYFKKAAVSFGATTLTNTGAVGTSDFFLIKYNPAGAALWVKSAGGSFNDEGHGVAVDKASGNIFVTGIFSGQGAVPITFSPYTLPAYTNLPAPGTLDPFFIVKYDPNGNVLCADELASGGGEEYDNSIAVDAFGNAYVAGDFYFSPLAVGASTLYIYPLNGVNYENIYVAKYNCSQCQLAGQFTKGTAFCAGCDCKQWIMVNATGGTSPYTYLWPDGYDKRYKNNICPGSYTIYITDKNGCSVNVNLTAP